MLVVNYQVGSAAQSGGLIVGGPARLNNLHCGEIT
jgi:hypothetical protein